MLEGSRFGILNRMLSVAKPHTSPPPPTSASEMDSQTPAKIEVDGLNFYYGARRALTDIHVKIRRNEVTALIGPSGCGKSTFLRTLNRMNDIVPGARVEGRVTVDGTDIYAPGV